MAPAKKGQKRQRRMDVGDEEYLPPPAAIDEDTESDENANMEVDHDDLDLQPGEIEVIGKDGKRQVVFQPDLAEDESFDEAVTDEQKLEAIRNDETFKLLTTQRLFRFGGIMEYYAEASKQQSQPEVDCSDTARIDKKTKTEMIPCKHGTFMLVQSGRRRKLVELKPEELAKPPSSPCTCTICSNRRRNSFEIDFTQSRPSSNQQTWAAKYGSGHMLQSDQNT